MGNESLTVERAKEIIESITYKPGWTISFVDTRVDSSRWEGIIGWIAVEALVPNSNRPVTRIETPLSLEMFSDPISSAVDDGLGRFAKKMTVEVFPVSLRRAIQPNLDEEQFRHLLWTTIREVEMHEIDEFLRFGWKRYKEPHPSPYPSPE